ncbi:MAG TPA: hypothetical protein VFJ84_01630 [Candidatus Saccharimonadales bacterium]|nr:hypothetical protein [Candidatus Saccharimonadales bacterium]
MAPAAPVNQPVASTPSDPPKYNPGSVYPVSGQAPSAATSIVMPPLVAKSETEASVLAPVPWGVIIISSVLMSGFIYSALLVAASLLLSVSILNSHMALWYICSVAFFALGASMIRKSELARLLTVGLLGVGLLYMIYSFIKVASSSLVRSFAISIFSGSLGARVYAFLALETLAIIASIIYLNLPRVRYWFQG